MREDTPVWRHVPPKAEIPQAFKTKRRCSAKPEQWHGRQKTHRPEGRCHAGLCHTGRARELLAGVGGGEGFFFGGGCEADIDGEGVGIDEAVDDAGDFLGVAGAGEFSAIVGGADEAEDVGLFASGGNFERAMHVAETQLNSIFFHADERDFDEGGFAIAANLVEGSHHVIAAGERPALVVDGLVGIDAEP